MDYATFNDITRELHRCHPEAMAKLNDEARYELSQLLELLPDEGEWMVMQPRLGVWARSGETLFTILIDPESQSVTVTSRRSDPNRVAVAVSWGEVTNTPFAHVRATEWTFRDETDGTPEDERLTTIVGEISTRNDGAKALDRAEVYARRLANAAGWDSLPEPEARELGAVSGTAAS
ncbi:MAG TPA: hypothetical protein VNV44_11805 [Solirubrobacteraceae bacterium]|jgi:hypothetical protein|nr:hypothetical protein [Solirubrobacteraceae bacterium]